MQKVLALGFFDGVHLGHGALLRRAKELADQYGAISAALTFDRNPGKEGALLTSVSDRTRLIKTLYGINEVLVLPFDDALRQTDWEDFLSQLVREQNAVCLVCGWDYRFGRGAEGTPEKLRRFCKAENIGCEIIPRTELDGITVSSTYLRQLVTQGDMERAAEFYGHPHTLSGKVTHGQQLGRRLGTPTANVSCEEGILLPQNGVYAVKAMADGASYIGVCNVGTRPTVDGKDTVIEVWLPGQALDLYGKTVTVDFYRKLRDEQKFASLDELKDEIVRNAAQAEAYFAERKE